MLVTGLILIGAIAVLAWGFQRARPYGKIGLLSWLQSLVLMGPWLLFFGLFALGIYINLAGVLLLLLISTGIYIYLGRRLRKLGQDEFLARRAAALISDDAEAHSEAVAETDSASNKGKIALTPEALNDGAMAIPREELTQIEGIFGIDTYFRTETVPYQKGAIFRGNLRGDPVKTHTHLSTLLKERLGEKYRLFLLENAEGRPTIVVLPATMDPPKITIPQAILAVVLGLATLFTSLEAGGIFQEFDLVQSPERWPEAMPIAAGIIAVLLTHEIGHRLMARRYGVQLSPPFFLPTWQIGSFGALTRFESLLPNRNVLFDISLAGPAAGGLLSLTLLVIGLALSHPGSLFQIPSHFFQESVLVGALARVVLGNALQEPLVDVHPLTIIGWLGLVITAINLMPAGQLDGGRIVQAIYGRKVTGRSTVITLIVLALVSLANALALYWAAVILLLQRSLERPCLNDLSEPDDARAALGLLALFLMLATLLPLTPSLAGRLGIGA